MKLCEWCKEKETSKPTNRFCSILCKNRYISSKNDYTKIGDKLRKPPVEMNCLECKQIFLLAPKDERTKKFCSQSCSARFNNKNRSEEVWLKQSNTMKNKIINGDLWYTPTTIYDKKCPVCEIDFKVSFEKRNKIHCSNKCSLVARRSKSKESLKHYRRLCIFTFGLSDYPDEFDFELIKRHGWYSPSNKKNNLGGVSRDHMFSVKEGFLNKIEPEILKHPANCKLMIHNENISKNHKSTITLEQLLQRIEEWDKKYNIKVIK